MKKCEMVSFVKKGDLDFVLQSNFACFPKIQNCVQNETANDTNSFFVGTFLSESNMQIVIYTSVISPHPIIYSLIISYAHNYSVF